MSMCTPYLIVELIYFFLSKTYFCVQQNKYKLKTGFPLYQQLLSQIQLYLWIPSNEIFMEIIFPMWHLPVMTMT